MSTARRVVLALIAFATLVTTVLAWFPGFVWYVKGSQYHTHEEIDAALTRLIDEGSITPADDAACQRAFVQVVAASTRATRRGYGDHTRALPPVCFAAATVVVVLCPPRRTRKAV